MLNSSAKCLQNTHTYTHIHIYLLYILYREIEIHSKSQIQLKLNRDPFEVVVISQPVSPGKHLVGCIMTTDAHNLQQKEQQPSKGICSISNKMKNRKTKKKSSSKFRKATTRKKKTFFKCNCCCQWMMLVLTKYSKKKMKFEIHFETGPLRNVLAYPTM